LLALFLGLVVLGCQLSRVMTYVVGYVQVKSSEVKPCQDPRLTSSFTVSTHVVRTCLFTAVFGRCTYAYGYVEIGTSTQQSRPCVEPNRTIGTYICMRMFDFCFLVVPTWTDSLYYLYYLPTPSLGRPT
ncbi:hypothetical protein F4859DRAFT_479835, partial [Xylaria cf. heliscus]